MTLLGYNDGTDHYDGASYLELAEFIMQHGSNVKQDFRRTLEKNCFQYMCYKYRRPFANHGFLFIKEGWTLSPAYDVNPIETRTG